MPKVKILIVEDEAITAEALRIDLQKMGYVVCSLAPSGEMAIEIAEKERPDVALMDIRLRGGMNGFVAAGEIKSRLGIPSIYMTGFAKEKVKAEAPTKTPFGFLSKPVKDDELEKAINSILKGKNNT
jgi:CheY-like chemotaxis protein